MATAVMRAVGPGVRARRVVGVQSVRCEKRDELALLVCLLEDWARWCRGDLPRLGFAPKAAGLSTGGVYTRLEDMEVSASNSRMEQVDAAVEDLSPGMREAIKRRYGLQAVFRFGRYEDVLVMAHDALLIALPRKGVDIV